MMENKYHRIFGAKPCIIVLILLSVILVCFPDLSWSGTRKTKRGDRFQDVQLYPQKMPQGLGIDFNCPEKNWFNVPSPRIGLGRLLSKNYKNRYNRLSPEEKSMLKRRYQQWESLPEERQQMLRRRMKKYEHLPLQKKERYRHRYRQLQKLPPNERYEIREKLRKWDSLLPEEQEQIRRRFRNP